MTYSEWLDMLLSEIPDKYQLSPGFPMYDAIAAWALGAERLEKELEDAKLLLNPENLTGIELDSYVYDRAGIERILAEPAAVKLTVTGTGLLPAGTIFIADTGVSFYTLTDQAIDGSGTVDAICNSMGSEGNVAAGTINTYSRTLPGFDDVTNTLPATGGADQETDEELLERFYLKMRTPPTSGNIYAYKEWALENTGVGSVKVFPLGHGDGTVDVVITSEEGGEADETLIAAVQNYIDPDSTGEGRGVAPIGAKCYVESAQEKGIQIDAEITLDGTLSESVVDASLQAKISEMLYKTFGDGEVMYGKIAKIIANEEGVTDFENLLLDSDMESITLGSREIAVIETWNVSYA